MFPLLLLILSLCGTFLGSQEALEAFSSLGSLVRLGGLVPLSPEHPLVPGASQSLQKLVFSQTQGPCPPCSPLPPVTSLGPQEAFRSLWQPWVFNQTQGPCSPCPLSLPALLGSPWSLKKPWEPSEALGLQSDSGTFSPCSLTPPCP